MADGENCIKPRDSIAHMFRRPDSSTMPLTDSISVLGGYEVIALIALAQVTEVKSKPFMRRPPKYVDLRTEILLTLESLAVWMGQCLQTIAFQEHSKKDAPTKLRDLETASKRHSSVTNTTSNELTSRFPLL